MLGFGVTKIPFLNVFLDSFVSNLRFEYVVSRRYRITIYFSLFRLVPRLYGLSRLQPVLNYHRFRCYHYNNLRSRSLQRKKRFFLADCAIWLLFVPLPHDRPCSDRRFHGTAKVRSACVPGSKWPSKIIHAKVGIK